MDNTIVYNSIRDAYRYARQNDARAEAKFVQYFDEGKSNPCVAEILRKDALNSYMKQYSGYIEDDLDRGRDYSDAMHELKTSKLNLVKNTIDLTSKPDVFNHEHEFNKNMLKLYPKTIFLRNQIINENRISFNNKKTPKKINFFKKIQMKLRSKEMHMLASGKIPPFWNIPLPF